MENNIFFRQKKDKYNPDIMNKLTQKDSERTNTNFNMTTTIYNPITGIVPSKISESNDLVLDKDSCFTKNDIAKLIMKKEEERVNQDLQFKPVKTKVINTNSTTSNSTTSNSTTSNSTTSNSTTSNSTTSNSTNANSSNYIATYNELKNGNNMVKKQEKTTDNQQKIIQGLKDLGIFK
jgi:hypothetical protein